MIVGDLRQGSRLDDFFEQGFNLLVGWGRIRALGLVSLNSAGMANAAFLGLGEGDLLMRKISQKESNSLLTKRQIP